MMDFDCWARSQPSKTFEKNNTPRSWDEREHAQAEARRNAIIHTNIEFLLKHCGKQEVLSTVSTSEAQCRHEHLLPYVNKQTPYHRSYARDGGAYYPQASCASSEATLSYSRPHNTMDHYALRKARCRHDEHMIPADFSIEDALDASARAFDAELRLAELTRSAGYLYGHRRDGSPVSKSEVNCKDNHFLPNTGALQANCASSHAAQAAGPWQSMVHGSHADAHAPLVTPPSPSLAMGGTLSDDKMVARLITECEQNYTAEDSGFGRLRWLYGSPLHVDVAIALGPSSPGRRTTNQNPNLIPVAVPPLPLAGLALAVGNDEIMWPAEKQVVGRKRTKLAGKDAVIIYQQKRTKTVHTAVKLGEEYNITAKTVRDIWRQRTWGEATRDYSTNGDAAITQVCLSSLPSPLKTADSSAIYQTRRDE